VVVTQAARATPGNTMTAMRIHALEKLHELARKAGCATDGISFSRIDFSRPFVPEHCTQLFYTPSYAFLTGVQKLRYNQLFGSRINEHFLMFEKHFANRVMGKLVSRAEILGEPYLGECLRQMMVEEESHQAMFRQLNRLCLPEIYAVDDHYFTALGSIEQFVFRQFTAIPVHLTFLLWIILFLEESTTVMSRAFLDVGRPETLGEVEANFVAAHAAHLKDEVRHLHIDVRLIRGLMGRQSAWKHRLNARLFRIFMNEILAPKRSGIAVVRHLVKEHPELAPRLPAMISDIKALRYDPRFLNNFFSEERMPYTYFLFNDIPDFRFDLAGV
jgi:hypothetical protein